MCKDSHFSVTNQENPEKILLRSVINLPVEARMDSMTLSSYGGIPMLKQEAEHLSIASQLASCIVDRRKKWLVRHSLEDLVLTRILQICLGWHHFRAVELSHYLVSLCRCPLDAVGYAAW
jgi:hypothetical protein